MFYNETFEVMGRKLWFHVKKAHLTLFISITVTTNVLYLIIIIIINIIISDCSRGPRGGATGINFLAGSVNNTSTHHQ